MRKDIILLVTFLLLSFQNALLAQEWGKISKDILRATSMPELPNAEAIILFDKGENHITYENKLIFKRHRRIKIFSEAGKKYANISISYWYKDTLEKIRAQVILPNGKKIKLNKKNIFADTDSCWLWIIRISA